MWGIRVTSIIVTYEHTQGFFVFIIYNHCLGIIHYFQHFCKSTESMLGGGGKSSCILSIVLILAIVLVHETSLADQHFYSMLLGEGGNM